MKATKLTFLLLGVPSVFFALEATAGILDQQNQANGGNGLVIANSQAVAQTFEVGFSGLLDRVEIALARNAVLPPEGLTLEVRSTQTDGSPMSSALASVPIYPVDISTSYQFLSLDLAPFEVVVTGGQVLALILHSSVEAQGGGIDPFAWGADAPGNYTRGAVFLDHGSGFLTASGWDVSFRTYVDTTIIPEPSILALSVIGVGTWICQRRCQRPEVQKNS